MINFISTMSISVILIQKNYIFRPNNPTPHYSNTPTVWVEVYTTPLWGETKAWSSGPGFFTLECFRWKTPNQYILLL